jgi:hypothetical protein
MLMVLPTLAQFQAITALQQLVISSASITLYGTNDQITVDQSGSTFTISLPSYINIDNGELHLKKTGVLERWNSIRCN